MTSREGQLADTDTDAAASPSQLYDDPTVNTRTQIETINEIRNTPIVFINASYAVRKDLHPSQ